MKSTYYMPSSVSTKEKWIDEYLNRRLRLSPPRKATFGFSDEAETCDDDSDDPSPPPSQLTCYTTADEIVTATPSPIPIPSCNITHYNAGHRRSYHHSPTPAQSSCVTASHRKFKSSSEDAPAEAEIEGGRRSAASHRPPPPPLHHRRSHHSPLRNRTGIDACSARPTRTRRSHHHRDRSIGRSFPHVLQAVDEEEWEMRRERGRRPSTSRYLWADDGYYPQAGYETPHIESRGRRPFSCVAATEKSRRKDTEGRIAALREARITELKNKLMKEEAAIDLREKKQIAAARRDMKAFELKLEKTRAVEMDKMLRRFRRAQKEAKKMKVKEQQETDKKIGKVIKEFNDIAISGKVPRWKCMICF